MQEKEVYNALNEKSWRTKYEIRGEIARKKGLKLNGRQKFWIHANDAGNYLNSFVEKGLAERRERRIGQEVEYEYRKTPTKTERLGVSGLLKRMMGVFKV